MLLSKLFSFFLGLNQGDQSFLLQKLLVLFVWQHEAEEISLFPLWRLLGCISVGDCLYSALQSLPSGWGSLGRAEKLASALCSSAEPAVGPSWVQNVPLYQIYNVKKWLTANGDALFFFIFWVIELFVQPQQNVLGQVGLFLLPRVSARLNAAVALWSAAPSLSIPAVCSNILILLPFVAWLCESFHQAWCSLAGNFPPQSTDALVFRGDSMEVWMVNLAYWECWRTLPIGKHVICPSCPHFCSNPVADLQLCTVTMLMPPGCCKAEWETALLCLSLSWSVAGHADFCQLCLFIC